MSNDYPHWEAGVPENYTGKFVYKAGRITMVRLVDAVSVKLRQFARTTLYHILWFEITKDPLCWGSWQVRDRIRFIEALPDRQLRNS